MTIYNPIKRSQTRSMNRGDSSAQAFRHDNTMHQVLASHGYYHLGHGVNGHEEGHSVTVGGNGSSAVIRPAGKKSSIAVGSWQGLQSELGAIHNKPGSKLSVSAGAAMDPALKKTFADDAAKETHHHHDVLIKHGYKHIKDLTPGYRVRSAIYKHPESGHEAQVYGVTGQGDVVSAVRRGQGHSWSDFNHHEGLDKHLKAVHGSGGGKFADIKNPNSSGQGHHADHDKHPFHEAITKAGWKYSHSTPVTVAGVKGVHHTYAHPSADHTVGVRKRNNGTWGWDAHHGGSGREVNGSDAGHLTSYLKRKSSEFKAPQAKIKRELQMRKNFGPGNI